MEVKNHSQTAKLPKHSQPGTSLLYVCEVGSWFATVGLLGEPTGSYLSTSCFGRWLKLSPKNIHYS